MDSPAKLVVGGLTSFGGVAIGGTYLASPDIKSRLLSKDYLGEYESGEAWSEYQSLFSTSTSRVDGEDSSVDSRELKEWNEFLGGNFKPGNTNPPESNDPQKTKFLAKLKSKCAEYGNSKSWFNKEHIHKMYERFCLKELSYKDRVKKDGRALMEVKHGIYFEWKDGNNPSNNSFNLKLKSGDGSEFDHWETNDTGSSSSDSGNHLKFCWYSSLWPYKDRSFYKQYIDFCIKK